MTKTDLLSTDSEVERLCERINEADDESVVLAALNDLSSYLTRNSDSTQRVGRSI